MDSFGHQYLEHCFLGFFFQYFILPWKGLRLNFPQSKLAYEEVFILFLFLSLCQQGSLGQKKKKTRLSAMILSIVGLRSVESLAFHLSG